MIKSPPRDEDGSGGGKGSGGSGGGKGGTTTNNKNNSDNPTTKSSSSSSSTYIDDYDYTIGTIVKHCSNWLNKDKLNLNYQARYGDISVRTASPTWSFLFDNETMEVLKSAYRKGQDEMRAEGEMAKKIKDLQEAEATQKALRAKKIKDLHEAEEARKLAAQKQREEKLAEKKNSNAAGKSKK